MEPPRDAPLPAPADGAAAASTLTGAYVLIVASKPREESHRAAVLQQIKEGLMSWDEAKFCPIALELGRMSKECPKGEDDRNGEKLIQYASEDIIFEILIHPCVNTLQQCIRNLLSSCTRYKHIIHAGYTFLGSGSWCLQDGTFSFEDFLDICSESDVFRVLKAYEDSIQITVHCLQENPWNTDCLAMRKWETACKLIVNFPQVISCRTEFDAFIQYIEKFLPVEPLECMLKSTEIIGSVRFTRPTVYIFPAGQGDCSLFGVNGFSMLVDAGFSRRCCFWDFVRHLDRLDSILFSTISSHNLEGMASFLERKVISQVYPQIGHFMGNVCGWKRDADGGNSRNPLITDIRGVVGKIVESLSAVGLKPQPLFCNGSATPVNLYRKVGYGTLNMYVLNPCESSEEFEKFLYLWKEQSSDLSSETVMRKVQNREAPVSLLDCISACVALIWIPESMDDRVTRLLFTGSCPEDRILDALKRLLSVEEFRYPAFFGKSGRAKVPGADLECNMKNAEATSRKRTTKLLGRRDRPAHSAPTELKTTTNREAASRVSSSKVQVKERNVLRDAAGKPKQGVAVGAKKSVERDGRSIQESPLAARPDKKTPGRPLAADPAKEKAQKFRKTPEAKSRAGDEQKSENGTQVPAHKADKKKTLKQLENENLQKSGEERASSGRKQNAALKEKGSSKAEEKLGKVKPKAEVKGIRKMSKEAPSKPEKDVFPPEETVLPAAPPAGHLVRSPTLTSHFAPEQLEDSLSDVSKVNEILQHPSTGVRTEMSQDEIKVELTAVYDTSFFSHGDELSRDEIISSEAEPPREREDLVNGVEEEQVHEDASRSQPFPDSKISAEEEKEISAEEEEPCEVKEHPFLEEASPEFGTDPGLLQLGFEEGPRKEVPVEVVKTPDEVADLPDSEVAISPKVVCSSPDIDGQKDGICEDSSDKDKVENEMPAEETVSPAEDHSGIERIEEAYQEGPPPTQGWVSSDGLTWQAAEEPQSAAGDDREEVVPVASGEEAREGDGGSSALRLGEVIVETKEEPLPREHLDPPGLTLTPVPSEADLQSESTAKSPKDVVELSFVRDGRSEGHEGSYYGGEADHVAPEEREEKVFPEVTPPEEDLPPALLPDEKQGDQQGFRDINGASEEDRERASTSPYRSPEEEEHSEPGALLLKEGERGELEKADGGLQNSLEPATAKEAVLEQTRSPPGHVATAEEQRTELPQGGEAPLPSSEGAPRGLEALRGDPSFPELPVSAFENGETRFPAAGISYERTSSSGSEDHFAEDPWTCRKLVESCAVPDMGREAPEEGTGKEALRSEVADRRSPSEISPEAIRLPSVAGKEDRRDISLPSRGEGGSIAEERDRDPSLGKPDKDRLVEPHGDAEQIPSTPDQAASHDFVREIDRREEEHDLGSRSREPSLGGEEETPVAALPLSSASHLSSSSVDLDEGTRARKKSEGEEPRPLEWESSVVLATAKGDPGSPLQREGKEADSTETPASPENKYLDGDLSAPPCDLGRYEEEKEAEEQQLQKSVLPARPSDDVVSSLPGSQEATPRLLRAEEEKTAAPDQDGESDPGSKASRKSSAGSLPEGTVLSRGSVTPPPSGTGNGVSGEAFEAADQAGSPEQVAAREFAAGPSLPENVPGGVSDGAIGKLEGTTRDSKGRGLSGQPEETSRFSTSAELQEVRGSQREEEHKRSLSASLETRILQEPREEGSSGSASPRWDLPGEEEPGRSSPPDSRKTRAEDGTRIARGPSPIGGPLAEVAAEPVLDCEDLYSPAPESPASARKPYDFMLESSICSPGRRLLQESDSEEQTTSSDASEGKASTTAEGASKDWLGSPAHAGEAEESRDHHAARPASGSPASHGEDSDGRLTPDAAPSPDEESSGGGRRRPLASLLDSFGSGKDGEDVQSDAEHKLLDPSSSSSSATADVPAGFWLAGSSEPAAVDACRSFPQRDEGQDAEEGGAEGSARPDAKAVDGKSPFRERTLDDAMGHPPTFAAHTESCRDLGLGAGAAWGAAPAAGGGGLRNGYKPEEFYFASSEGIVEEPKDSRGREAAPDVGVGRAFLEFDEISVVAVINSDDAVRPVPDCRPLATCEEGEEAESEQTPLGGRLEDQERLPETAKEGAPAPARAAAPPEDWHRDGSHLAKEAAGESSDGGSVGVLDHSDVSHETIEPTWEEARRSSERCGGQHLPCGHEDAELVKFTLDEINVEEHEQLRCSHVCLAEPIYESIPIQRAEIVNVDDSPISSESFVGSYRNASHSPPMFPESPDAEATDREQQKRTEDPAEGEALARGDPGEDSGEKSASLAGSRPFDSEHWELSSEAKRLGERAEGDPVHPQETGYTGASDSDVSDGIAVRSRVELVRLLPDQDDDDLLQLETGHARATEGDVSDGIAVRSRVELVRLLPDQDDDDPLKLWGEPQGLPIPSQNGKAFSPKGWDRRRSDDSEDRASDPCVYFDLVYVPCQANPRYTSAEFFQTVRSRHYVISSTNPNVTVLDALLEGKAAWNDKEMKTTVIPTYEGETLTKWVTENEDLLSEHHIEVTPSASRCTINLQDYDTCCNAYRLEL